MLQIMLQKILHKKWMVISLLIGNILLIAVAASHPMYQDASLQRMLTDEFGTYIEDNNENPAMLSVVGRLRKSGGSGDYNNMKTLVENVCDELGVKEQLRVTHSTLIASTARSLLELDGSFPEKKIKIGTMIDLENHTDVVSGRMYSDGLAEDGCIEAVVTMNGFVKMNLLIGQELEFKNLRDEEKNPYHVRIVGVVNNREAIDPYWVEGPDSFAEEILISPKVFDAVFVNGATRFEYNTQWYVLFDYESVPYENAADIIAKTRTYVDSKTIFGKVYEPAYLALLENFVANEKKVDITLTILQVPVMVLLCAFLFMISRQMIEMEQSEISLFKSRGASKGQIFRLYLMQSGFLALISLAAGLPLGSLLCRVLGSASAFLEFVQRRPLAVRYTGDVFLYAGGAVLVSILMTVLPVIKQSGISIVGQKRAKARSKKPLWQKLFLDVIILALSLYGYNNFERHHKDMISAVMTGEALDPLLFMSSSLFILGAALFCLRLQPLLVKLVYFIGRKLWKPAGYASFLQIIRTGSRQYFIMTFLMLTVALGIFNTTVARTILANAEENLVYNTGADIVMQEVWPNNELLVQMGMADELVYKEPDYGKYGEISDVNAMTKVYVNDEIKLAKATGKDTTSDPVTLYAINTKSFGEATNLPDGLMEEHFYSYLNKLAINSDTVLLSSSFRDVLGYEVGDSISFQTGMDDKISATVCGFVDYFPGFQTSTTGIYPDGSAYQTPCYLIVAHLSMIQKTWGVKPYQIWFDVNSTKGFYEFIEKNNISLSMCVDTAVELANIKRDTLFCGTNGILTMSFIIILILCSAGYLIYWILSIRSRELLFGIFRAMGMSRGEIIRMLLNEQLFSSLLSIACGAGIGVLASRMFVPMIQLAYSVENQVLPMKLITQDSDMVRLFGIIAAVFVVCLAVLTRQIFKMKIAQALKLGED